MAHFLLKSLDASMLANMVYEQSFAVFAYCWHNSIKMHFAQFYQLLRKIKCINIFYVIQYMLFSMSITALSYISIYINIQAFEQRPARNSLSLVVILAYNTTDSIFIDIILTLQWKPIVLIKFQQLKHISIVIFISVNYC